MDQTLNQRTSSINFQKIPEFQKNYQNAQLVNLMASFQESNCVDYQFMQANYETTKVGANFQNNSQIQGVQMN